MSWFIVRRMCPPFDSGPLTMGPDETWSCGESIICLSYLCLCHRLPWQLETRGSYMFFIKQRRGEKKEEVTLRQETGY